MTAAETRIHLLHKCKFEFKDITMHVIQRFKRSVVRYTDLVINCFLSGKTHASDIGTYPFV